MLKGNLIVTNQSIVYLEDLFAHPLEFIIYCTLLSIRFLLSFQLFIKFSSLNLVIIHYIETLIIIITIKFILNQIF